MYSYIPLGLNQLLNVRVDQWFHICIVDTCQWVCIRPNTDVASISSVLHLVWPLAKSLSSMVVPARSQNSSWHSLWDLGGTQAPQLRQSSNTLGEQEEVSFHILKRITMKTLSRHPQDTVDNGMMRIQFQPTSKKQHQQSLLTRLSSQVIMHVYLDKWHNSNGIFMSNSCWQFISSMKFMVNFRQ